MGRPAPKNVIWITTDHMRYDCIGAHGNAAMHTPNLDFLVEHGVSFHNCFAQNPVSMPSRASFMTGLYPEQTGVTTNGHVLPADFPLVPARLFARGDFQTAQIGKLHFQEHEDSDLDPRARHDYGFDVFWIAEEAGCYEDAYMTWLRTEHPELVETFRVPRSTSPERIGEREGRVLDASWEASHSGWIAVQADRYLRGRARAGRHFVHLGFFAPHPPLNPTREMFAPYDGIDLPPPRVQDSEWADKPRPLSRMLRGLRDWTPERFESYRRHFYALVTGVDLAVGRVLGRLREEGALDDTLVVFTSDHGDMCGDHGMIAKGSSFFDEIMHVPCVLYWPAGLGAERRDVAGIMELVDLLPTMLGLSGLTVPKLMSGRSYAEALLGTESPKGREDAFAFVHPDWAMLRTERHKYIRYNSLGTEVLYDLDESPREVKNRAADPEYAGALAEMRERMLTRALDASRSALPKRWRF